MEDDDGQDGGVVVPLSLIKMLAESNLATIDKWHEQRGIHDMNISMCIMAMLAAIDATVEEMREFPDGMTLQ